MTILLIDFHDSYTYNVADLIFRALGVWPTLVAFDDPSMDASLIAAHDAVVLSPGPGTPENPRDVGAVAGLIEASDRPVLGVCLGHQILAQILGATVTRVRPRHGHVSTLTATEDPRSIVIDGQQVVRYHSLAVQDLPPTIVADAWSEDGVLQAFHATHRPWWGVQFHPESVLSEGGLDVVRRWAALVGLPVPEPLPEPIEGSRWLRQTQPPDISAPAPSPSPLPEPHLHPVSEPAEGALLHLEIPVPHLPAAHECLACDDGPSFWLDSALVVDGLSRYSFVGIADRILLTDGDGTRLTTRDGALLQQWPQDHNPLDILRAHLTPTSGGPDVPFRGGWVGYLGYEARRFLGYDTPHQPAEPTSLWLHAGRYLAVDHVADRAWLVARQSPDAEAWLAQTADALAHADAPAVDLPPQLIAQAASLPQHRDLDDDAYRAAIESIHEHLHAGDSYEVCLTTTAAVPLQATPAQLREIYRRQRVANPAPYAAFLHSGQTTVLCSSPERFLQVRDGDVETKPIKGTAPRGRTAEDDAALKAALAHDPKTRAELLMVVDLLRNDLARVCAHGSVETPDVLTVETYASVHQLLSRITGQLADDVDVCDLIAATFPGGSMTGAPKERTMQIIDDLEQAPRGIYSGCLGYLCDPKNADLNIVIRTLVHHRGTLSAGAGGAIVSDSTPQGELDEMLLKLAAPIRWATSRG